MPEPTTYPPGALCWADLLAPEPAAAERFYADVLGWEYVHAGAAFDDYAYATHARHMVAGIAGGEADAEGFWVVAFATDRADALAERIVAAGGEVIDGPRDFGIQGRSLVAVDAAGAHVGFWQPRAHLGAGLVGAPGALCWAELAVRDVAAADAFYHAVLGLRAGAHAAAGSPDYAAYLLDGATPGDAGGGVPVAGRTVLGPEASGVEPFWMPYFGVTDAAGTAALATDRGATLRHLGADATGRGLAVLSDPWGATFAVLELAPGT
ncbi:VOC family protein [Streptomyces sp. B6B3]|uniref:VOC family protein n=1 Tax=Streptomyces sp. B6B3 TaxID=3153570 RepID=UPI00325E12C4